jgi:hypothetical protein
MLILGINIIKTPFVSDDPTPFFEILAEDDSYMVAENGDFLIIES